ncbi:MAG: alpha/beta hydrolase [Bdellovibrionota bacterium]
MLTKKISKLLSMPMSKSIIVSSVISDAAKSGFFETVDGISLYYEDTQAPGEVLFFIYGLGCSISHWKYQMSYFLDKSNKSKGVTQKYRIVWMDFRNHGRSGKCQSSQLSVVQLAEDVKQCCDVLGIHKAIFLGQSMGGSVLLQLAHSYPKLVKKMVLQGSPPIAPSRTICTSPLAPFAWKRMIQLNKLSPMSVRLIHKSLSGISRPLMEAARFSGFNPQLVNSDDVMEYVKLLLASDANVF